MQRTTGLESDAGGRDRTLVWEPNEIGIAARVVAAAAVATSEVIYLEGFRHFHVYVNRSATIALSVRVFPARPEVRTGNPPLAAAAGVVIGAWAGGAGTGTSGIFYFGELLLLTDATGRNFRFGPLMFLEIENTGASPVTIDAWVHAQD